MTKKNNYIWVVLFGLPIAACVLFAISDLAVILGLACLAAWFLADRASLSALRDGHLEAWSSYLTGKKAAGAQPHPSNPVQPQPQKPKAVSVPPAPPQEPKAVSVPPVRPQPIQTPPVQPQAYQPQQVATRWRKDAPSFSGTELVGTLECLNWSEADVEALANEAGERLQYALAYRMAPGRDLADTPRLRALQMTEIAERLRRDMPDAAACRAWPMRELTRNMRMDGLLLAPSNHSPLGLYAFLTGINGASRFVVLSMFVPVGSEKANDVVRLYRPNPSELAQERQWISRMLENIERYAVGS